MKRFASPSYNYMFNPKTGFFARWGATQDDDPTYSPFGSEIADIEITTICHGPEGKVCKFCYKSNTPHGVNMSFETFKNVFHKINPHGTLTQIAFGADATSKANPDIWKMFEYSRKHGVIPNITLANVDELTAARLNAICGGVAISRYTNKNICYDSVARLVGVGMQQVVIHQLLSQETYQQALETIQDVHTDERLRGLKAIIFLSLKKKGRGKNYEKLSQEQFTNLVELALAHKVPFGFDTCSANKFVQSVKNRPEFSRMVASIEPCEATCFSLYVDVHGKYFPCSFAPGWEDWNTGIDVLAVDDFKQDLWLNEKTNTFRNKLLTNLDENGIHGCPMYDI